MREIKTYNLIFFDTFLKARQSKKEILEKSQNCDQLNVVIREEGNMDDPELLDIHPHVKVYAGQAWTTIHERRLAENWYKEREN